MKVFLTSVTERWSIFSLAGPKSREVLQAADCDIDIEKMSLPFMSCQSCQIAGIPARLSRISFSGELAFEITVNSDYALDLWITLIDKGTPFGITPYGTEAMHVLRAEKGYPIIGQDTDGSVTPIDLGFSHLISKNKDFIGKRSLFRSDTVRSDRKQLVGLRPVISDFILPEGAQLVDYPQSTVPVKMIGHVTSSYFSKTLGSSFALALVKNGHNRKGDKIFAHLMDDSKIPVEICDPVFYDPNNNCQRI